MNKKFSAEATVAINASPAKVWDALTDPEKIKRYLYGTETVTDWQEGSSITYRGVWEGKAYEDKGTILKIEPPTYMLTTYYSSFSGDEDAPENYANIEYKLVEEDGQTILTVTQDNIKSQEAAHHSKNNWQTVLNDLKKMLENG